MIVYDHELKYFYSTLLNKGKISTGFMSKLYGDARQTNTIFDILRALQTSYNKIVIPEQIHSVNIKRYMVDTPNLIDRITETDGVITSNMNTVLTIITGDCVPIVYSDPVNGIIGISHQGWRGSLKKMPQKMILKMTEAGADLKHISVAIGPSIGACCYVVNDDLYYTFKSELDGYSDKVFYTSHGKYHMNLTYMNYLILLNSGISKERIDFFPFCTKCDTGRFFSFRRDKKADFGEMLSFVILRQ